MRPIHWARMHIALYFHGRVPVHGYGGTQRVVAWLARGLAQFGHRVTLLAAEGSRIPGLAIIELDPRATSRPGFDLTPFLPIHSTSCIHTPR